MKGGVNFNYLEILCSVHQPVWYFDLLVSLLCRHYYEILYSEPLLSLVRDPGCTSWTTNILEGQKCVFRYVVVNIQYADKIQGITNKLKYYFCCPRSHRHYVSKTKQL
jgi:hypothetical protein